MTARAIRRIIKHRDGGFLLLNRLTIFLLLVLFGCSPVPSHKTLSFFFDGVPDPGQSQTVVGNTSNVKADTSSVKVAGVISEKPAVNYHKPFKDKKCGVCHDQNTMGKFLKPQPALCYQCHEDYSKEYKVVHGPVGGGYCTACHEQHSSVNKKLLKRVTQDLCFYCHNPSPILKSAAHKDIADQSCTNCHNPHGGRDRSMLK
jgi:predicted CXXCH cytochrome family protein